MQHVLLTSSVSWVREDLHDTQLPSTLRTFVVLRNKDYHRQSMMLRYCVCTTIRYSVQVLRQLRFAVFPRALDVIRNSAPNDDLLLVSGTPSSLIMKGRNACSSLTISTKFSHAKSNGRSNATSFRSCTCEPNALLLCLPSRDLLLQLSRNLVAQLGVWYKPPR